MNFCFLLLTILTVKKVVSYPNKVQCDLTLVADQSKNIQTTSLNIMGVAPTEGTYVTSLMGNSAVTGGTLALTVAGASNRGIIHATGGTLSCAGGAAATGCTGTMSMCSYDSSVPAVISWTAPGNAGDYVIFFATSSGPATPFGRQSITIAVTGAGVNTAAPTGGPTGAPTTPGTTGAPTVTAVAGLTCSVGIEAYTSAGATDANVEYTDVAASGVMDTCMEVTSTFTDATTTMTSCVRMLQMNAACVPSSTTAGGASVVTKCCQTNLCNSECVASAPKSNSAVSLVPYSAIVIAAIFQVFA